MKLVTHNVMILVTTLISFKTVTLTVTNIVTNHYTHVSCLNLKKNTETVSKFLQVTKQWMEK